MKKRIGNVDTKFYVENGKVYPVFVDEEGKYIVTDEPEAEEKKEEKSKKKGE